MKTTKKTIGFIKEAYKARVKSNDPNKLIFNNKIAELVKKDGELKMGTAVILDVETTLTLKALLSVKYPRNKIDIVNCVPEVFKRIKAKHSNTFNDYLGNYLKDIADANLKESISVAGLDYCCSIIGNENIQPMKDIELLFTEKLLAKPSLLVVTLSWRAGKNKEEGSFASITKLDNLITQESYYNDYRPVKVDGLSYTGGMFYLMYKLLS
jgi:hypothetical protein